VSLVLLLISIGLAAAIFALTVGWLVLERRGSGRTVETETETEIETDIETVTGDDPSEPPDVGDRP